MAKIQIVEGDITQMKADALVTFANPLGHWHGGVDNALKRRFGTGFHDELEKARVAGRFTNGKACFVAGSSSPFKGVLFVCDDLDSPLDLYVLVETALKKAAEIGAKEVVVPVFRTGYAFDYFEMEAIERELIGILKTVSFNGTITIVVYRDPDQANRLRALAASA